MAAFENPPEDSADFSARARIYSVTHVTAKSSDLANMSDRDDTVVIEEPMEIRLVCGAEGSQKMRSLSITMRTPGNDEELAAGFLKTEGIIDSAQQIAQIKTLGNDADGQPTGNIVRVDLRADVEVDFGSLQRNFFTTSSCGVCGKASLDALEVKGLQPLADGDWQVDRAAIHQMPAALRSQQPTFEQTGGLHAAAMFTLDGELSMVREDVGRHNAVDKLVGRCLLDGRTPMSECVMVISGRGSFEIMQKALVAGIPAIVAVGAPSSLAVDTARHYNMTLIGFASGDRFNIYTGKHRIR